LERKNAAQLLYNMSCAQLQVVSIKDPSHAIVLPGDCYYSSLSATLWLLQSGHTINSFCNTIAGLATVR
jgi:hypothetical protein